MTDFKLTKHVSKVVMIGGVVAVTFFSNAHAQDVYIGKEVAKIPIFDAHIHYKEPAWKEYPPRSILELMDQNGVAMGLVSSTPDEGTIKLYEFAPNRIIPELRPYHGDYGSSNWTKMPTMFAYLKKRLAKFPHKGIGEFHIHDLDMSDKPLLQKIAQMAIEQGLYLHVHSDEKPIEFLFSLAPSVKIIWAHAGMSSPPDVIFKMMSKYDTLYADTSFRELDILSSTDGIDPKWRRVIETYPDRFMVGSDTWVNTQWGQYSNLISLNRHWLSQFTFEVAHQIAYKNAERIFNKKISLELLGQK
jgi:predicted TIM-barrel fold metal-dependent hydrolase